VPPFLCRDRAASGIPEARWQASPRTATPGMHVCNSGLRPGWAGKFFPAADFCCGGAATGCSINQKRVQHALLLTLETHQLSGADQGRLAGTWKATAGGDRGAAQGTERYFQFTAPDARDSGSSTQARSTLSTGTGPSDTDGGPGLPLQLRTAFPSALPQTLHTGLSPTRSVRRRSFAGRSCTQLLAIRGSRATSRVEATFRREPAFAGRH
jgi:hypothetical protein